MELQLTAAQNEWRDEVRDFLDTELPARWEKSTEWCEDEDFWAFAIDFTRKVSARGWMLKRPGLPVRTTAGPRAARAAATASAPRATDAMSFETNTRVTGRSRKRQHRSRPR